MATPLASRPAPRLAFGRMSGPTMHAQRAFDLAQSFDQRLGALRFGRERLALSLRRPDGPSTGNGAQARQTILLAGKDSAWVCGWVDLSRRRCALKSFERLRQDGRGRLIGAYESYEEAIRCAEAFFARRGLETQTLLAAPALAGDRRSSKGFFRRSGWTRPARGRVGPIEHLLRAAPALFGAIAGAGAAHWLFGS
jgi:hypothetical protein